MTSIEQYIQERRNEIKKEEKMVEGILQSITIPEGLNDNQTNTLMEVIREIPHFDFHSDMYEVKQMQIEPQEYGSIFCTFTTGLKDDEGTLASILYRKRRIFWIGKKGGIKVMNSNNNLIRCSIFELMNHYYES